MSDFGNLSRRAIRQLGSTARAVEQIAQRASVNRNPKAARSIASRNAESSRDAIKALEGVTKKARGDSEAVMQIRSAISELNRASQHFQGVAESAAPSRWDVMRGSGIVANVATDLTTLYEQAANKPLYSSFERSFRPRGGSVIGVNVAFKQETIEAVRRAILAGDELDAGGAKLFHEFSDDLLADSNVATELLIVAKLRDVRDRPRQNFNYIGNKLKEIGDLVGSIDSADPAVQRLLTNIKHRLELNLERFKARQYMDFAEIGESIPDAKMIAMLRHVETVIEPPTNPLGQVAPTTTTPLRW